MESDRYEKDILTKSFCDDVYFELTEMRLRLLTMNDELALTYGEDSDPYKTYKRHIRSLPIRLGGGSRSCRMHAPTTGQGHVRKSRPLFRSTSPT